MEPPDSIFRAMAAEHCAIRTGVDRGVQNPREMGHFFGHLHLDCPLHPHRLVRE